MLLSYDSDKINKRFSFIKIYTHQLYYNENVKKSIVNS